ncbi:MAG: helix-turn-helix domain-containing protein, partial [Acidobacteriota bacterium]
LSVREAAKLARVGVAQIYALAKTPGFPARRFGKLIRIHRDSSAVGMQEMLGPHP